MHTLVIIRHGESQWNKLNLFCGWTDVDLTETGYEEAHQAGRLLREGNYHFDICYTSVLKRAIHTAYTVLDELDLAWIPMVKDYHLNEDFTVDHVGYLGDEDIIRAKIDAVKMQSVRTEEKK